MYCFRLSFLRHLQRCCHTPGRESKRLSSNSQKLSCKVGTKKNTKKSSFLYLFSYLQQEHSGPFTCLHYTYGQGMSSYIKFKTCRRGVSIDSCFLHQPANTKQPNLHDSTIPGIVLIQRIQFQE